MSSIIDRSLTCFVLLVIFIATECRPHQQQAQGSTTSGNSNNPQTTFYVPPAASGGQQQLHQLPFLASASNQHQQILPQQQQQLSQPPIQLHIPIPNDGVEEKKIYVQLPPQHQQQQYPQQPQYRYPPRKHYKIILVRSPSPPTPPPAPILPEIEEQTLVYVLVKKPDAPSVAELQQHQQQSYKLNKPEVYFIKYKANEQRAEDASLGNSGGDAIASAHTSSEPVEKSSIEQQQLSNNLESAGGGYSYDGSRKREAKDLGQNDEVEQANKLTSDSSGGGVGNQK